MDASKPGYSKEPRLILPGIFAFAPSRDTLGGTAYLLEAPASAETDSSILIDAPAWDGTTQAFLANRTVGWLFISHRGNLGKAAVIQQQLGCKLVIQEQEAYLLPNSSVIRFHRHFMFNQWTQALWTPGHSPGSSCLYYSCQGGVLFTGRHLLPVSQQAIAPLRIAKTFHWPRQLQQVQRLQREFTPETLQYICPGANTGLMRGQMPCFKLNRCSRFANGVAPNLECPGGTVASCVQMIELRSESGEKLD